MKVIAGIKKDAEIEIEAKVRNVFHDMPNAQITIMKNIAVIIIDCQDNIGFEEIRRRLSSCNGINIDTICQDFEIQLID